MVAALTLPLPRRAIANADDHSFGATCAACFSALTSNYLWAIGLIAAGFGLHSYYVWELLAELTLLTFLFLSLGLVVLTAFVV
jgi:hypothetical protein